MTRVNLQLSGTVNRQYCNQALQFILTLINLNTATLSSLSSSFMPVKSAPGTSCVLQAILPALLGWLLREQALPSVCNGLVFYLLPLSGDGALLERRAIHPAVAGQQSDTL